MKPFAHLFGILTFATLSINAQVEVKSVSSVSNATQGVYYNLPKTTVYVDITVHKTTYIPGEYAIYAEQFLKLRDVHTEVKEQFSIAEVDVRWISEPDPSALYLITTAKNRSLPMLHFTPNGLLLAVNMQPDPITTPTLPLLATNSILQNIPMNPKDLMGEEFLASGSTIKMAEIVAKKIIAIRESRAEVLSGEAANMPKDGEAMKFIIATLNDQEKNLLSLFSGATKIETQHYRFALTPTSINDRQIAFRFSEQFGIVNANDLSGSPVIAHFTASPPKPQTLLTPKEEKNNDKRGFIYINPSQIDFVLSTQDKELYKNRFNMTQFGQIGVLPSTLFSPSKKIQMKLDPSLGRIIELKREQ